MRLIDADAMKRYIDPGHLRSATEICLSELNVIRMIDAQPTIDAEPVRHGQNATYTHPSDMFVCSECGFSCEITELRYGDDGMGEPDVYEYDCKFCPDCGAKMDAAVKGLARYRGCIDCARYDEEIVKINPLCDGCSFGSKWQWRGAEVQG